MKDRPKVAGASGPRLAAWTRGIRRSVLQDMLVATARSGVVSLALGLPSPELFPTSALGMAIAGLLDRDPRALQYGPSSTELRAFVAALMARRGVACEPEQIFLTSGAQQGMSLLASLLLEPGATVMCEDHSYTGFHQAIAPHRPRLVTVPSSLETGIDVAAVARGFERARPALLYAMSEGHNPMGVSMPLDARRKLVAAARSWAVPIIEDDAYGLISFDGEERPALRAFDADWVLYLGSFSKTLAPALRTGWIVVPERLVDPLAALKESSDIDTATLGQRAVAAFVASGGFEDHLRKLRLGYALQRDAMLDAIERSFGTAARWSRPRSGFFTWLELPEGVDAVSLLEFALEHEHVAFLPGAAFAAAGAVPARSSLRLSFSYHAPQVLEEGIARIARALEALGESRRGARPGSARVTARAAGPQKVRTATPGKARVIRPQKTRAIRPGKASAIRPGKTRAIRPVKGRAIRPPKALAPTPGKALAIRARKTREKLPHDRGDGAGAEGGSPGGSPVRGGRTA